MISRSSIGRRLFGGRRISILCFAVMSVLVTVVCYCLSLSPATGRVAQTELMVQPAPIPVSTSMPISVPAPKAQSNPAPKLVTVRVTAPPILAPKHQSKYVPVPIPISKSISRGAAQTILQPSLEPAFKAGQSFATHPVPKPVLEKPSIHLSANLAATTPADALVRSDNRSTSDSSSSSFVIPTVCATPPCVTFYPDRFLRQQHSSYIIQYNRDANSTRIKKVGMKRVPGRLMSPRMLVFPQQHYIFCHIHKNGGTALMEAAVTAAAITKQASGNTTTTTTTTNNNNNTNTTTTTLVEVLYTHQEKRWGSERFDQVIDGHRHMDNMTYFSFVRDPVARYLSAIRQVLTKKQRAIVLTNDFPQCTVSNLVECAIDTIIQTGSFRNPHFLPQVFELKQCIGPNNNNNNDDDVGIILTRLKSMNAFVEHTLRNNVTLGTIQTSTISSSPTKLALNATFLQRICHLYSMDVQLIRGILSPNESPCLP